MFVDEKRERIGHLQFDHGLRRCLLLQFEFKKVGCWTHKHNNDIPKYASGREGKMAATIKNPFQSSVPNILLDKTNPEEGNPMNLCNFQNSLLDDVS